MVFATIEMGFPVNCPIQKKIETITKRKALKHKMRIDMSRESPTARLAVRGF